MTDSHKEHLTLWLDSQEYNSFEELMTLAYKEFPRYEDCGFILHMYMKYLKS
jgi:hypothetical protein